MNLKKLITTLIISLISASMAHGGPSIKFGKVEIFADMPYDEILEKLETEFDVKETKRDTGAEPGVLRFINFRVSDEVHGEVWGGGPETEPRISVVKKTHVYTNDFVSAYSAFVKVLQEASKKTGEKVSIGGKVYDQLEVPERVLESRKKSGNEFSYNLAMVRTVGSNNGDLKRNREYILFDVQLDVQISVSLNLMVKKRRDGSLENEFSVVETVIPAQRSGRW